LRVKGKLGRKSLKTISVAKLRLSDIERYERRMAEQGCTSGDGKILYTPLQRTWPRDFVR
jgi:hypothetical protein